MSYEIDKPKRVRKHKVVCTDCENSRWFRMLTDHLPGGFRVGCEECGRATVHRADRLHPDETLVATDESGEWVGRE